MAKKKKNANYVTDKTTQKKAAESKARVMAKRKKTAISAIITAAIAIVILGGIFVGMLLGGAFDYHPEVTEHVTIQLSGYSTTLHVELYGEDAPETVKHFKSLVNGHYYDGKSISAYKDGNLYFADASAGDAGIKGEFSKNGVKNKVPFEVGTLVMARGEGYDSGYARFFIVTEDTDLSTLGGEYAAFGKVSGGMEVIRELVGKLNPNADGSLSDAERVSIVSISAHDSH